MKNIVYFDLETQKSAQDVGGWGNKDKMGLSVGVTYSTARAGYQVYSEEQVEALWSWAEGTVSTQISLLADGQEVSFSHGFGPEVEQGYSGAIFATEPRCAESDLTNAEALSGKLALTHRGECSFAEKANRAAETGSPQSRHTP